MTDPESNPTLRRAIERLKALPEADPAARGRLRAALDRNPLPRRYTLILTPARALLAASIVALLTSALWVAALSYSPVGRRTQRYAGVTPVQFLLAAPEARSVSLAGDFNRWDPAATPLTPGTDGVWSVVVPLARGAFAYSFIVDGREWRADPVTPAASDDFGRPSSVLYVSQDTRP